MAPVLSTAIQIRNEACKEQKAQPLIATRAKGRIAFLFRGEAFRNDVLRESRSRCCKAGLTVQRMLFESHEKMFKAIIANGYQGIDVFGATYRCPSNVPSEYRTLEQNLSDWYSPWTNNHGSMRILDPALIQGSLGHQRAVVFDFWRAVASWGKGDNLEGVNPYDFAIELR